MPSGTKSELCCAKYEALWDNSVLHDLIKNTDIGDINSLFISIGY